VCAKLPLHKNESALVVTEDEKDNQFMLAVLSKSAVVIRTKVLFNNSEVIAL